MCGIVGYVGTRQAAPEVYRGLLRLEYRGYDSVGLAVLNGSSLGVVRKKGKVDAVREEIGGMIGTIGIGHTRWATHGAPSERNAHPLRSGKFAIVHNGIIENYRALREELEANGFVFSSDTDSETIAHLFALYDRGDLRETLRAVVRKLEGSFAIAALCEGAPNVIAAARRNSPLIVGRGETGYYLASDIPALAGCVQTVTVLKNGDMALVCADRVQIIDDRGEVRRQEQVCSLRAETLERGDNAHFMLKEMKETPQTIRNTISNFAERVRLEPFLPLFRKLKKIHLIGCGTAYHSGLAGKLAIERLARVPAEACIASEYRYGDPILGDDTLAIAVSQSGETADTIAAAQLDRESGTPLFVVTNVAHSSMASLADLVVPTIAGAETAVAATKSYNGQLTALYLLAAAIAAARGADAKRAEEELSRYPERCEEALSRLEEVERVAQKFKDAKNVCFLGRGVDHAAALEGSLKLKEIAYIPSEGYPAGELKHGPIALIDGRSLVVAIMTQRRLAEKTFNAVAEVRARGAKIFLITPFEEYARREGVDDCFLLPKCGELFSPVLSVIPLQALAYYTAVARGNDPDRPRNLAKSVTVE